MSKFTREIFDGFVVLAGVGSAVVMMILGALIWSWGDRVIGVIVWALLLWWLWWCRRPLWRYITMRDMDD